MAEVILRLRVLDHSGRRVGAAPLSDIWWQRTMDTPHLPDIGDEVQLWGGQDGPLASVKRRWWRPDGRVVVQLVEMNVDSAHAAHALDENNRLMWLPWSSGKGDPAELLRSSGWEVLPHD